MLRHSLSIAFLILLPLFCHAQGNPINLRIWCELEPMVQENEDYPLSTEEAQRRALEEARAAKTIGHSLDAAVTVGLTDDLYAALEPYRDDLRAIFIVSKAEMVKGVLPDGFSSEDMQGVSVKVSRADGEKCNRCWVHETTVGQQPGHPQICSRCYNTLKSMGQA